MGFAGVLYAQAATLPLMTEKRFYRPYGDAHQQILANIPLAKAFAAYCDSASLLSNRRDAWRCRVGQVELDPCFTDEDKPTTFLKCIKTPWSQEYQPISNIAGLTPRPEKTLDMSKDWPWGIELSDGEQCLRSGDNLYFQGQAVRYRCQNQGLLFGYIQHCKEPWSMLLKKRDGQLVSVALRRVWF